jgi:hypothetical protein
LYDSQVENNARAAQKVQFDCGRFESRNGSQRRTRTFERRRLNVRHCSGMSTLPASKKRSKFQIWENSKKNDSIFIFRLSN